MRGFMCKILYLNLSLINNSFTSLKNCFLNFCTYKFSYFLSFNKELKKKVSVMR